jgi:hypothetical protein
MPVVSLFRNPLQSNRKREEKKDCFLGFFLLNCQHMFLDLKLGRKKTQAVNSQTHFIKWLM